MANFVVRSFNGFEHHSIEYFDHKSSSVIPAPTFGVVLVTIPLTDEQVKLGFLEISRLYKEGKLT